MSDDNFKKSQARKERNAKYYAVIVDDLRAEIEEFKATIEQRNTTIHEQQLLISQYQLGNNISFSEPIFASANLKQQLRVSSLPSSSQLIVSSLPASNSTTSLITPASRKRSMNEMTASISDNNGGDDCYVGRADRDTDDYHHSEIQLHIPANTTDITLTKVSNAPKRCSSSSMGNRNPNCANKEPRRSSSIATCIHGRDESQCKEYGCVGSAFCIH
jgi:hypothetical protein